MSTIIIKKNIKDKLHAAVVLDVASLEVGDAIALLKVCGELIDEQQKLKKITNRSEHSWSTVEEYMEDKLAEDSDDRKCLFGAESRAGCKIKAKANKAKKPASSRWQSLDLCPMQCRVLFFLHSNHFLNWELLHKILLVVQKYLIGASYSLGVQCGKFGHFRRARPLLSQASEQLLFQELSAA